MYLLNVIKKVYVLLVICIMQSLLLHGMLDFNKDKTTACDIVVLNRLSHDDYHLYRTVAMLSKVHNEIIENRYRSKKQCIEKYIQENKDTLSPVTGAISWNKDFSKCAWLTYDGDVVTRKNLQLTLVGKCDNQVINRFTSWGDFYFPIFEDNICPLFDKDGRASFYGYGKTRTCDGECLSFVQYCLDLNGNDSRYCCCFYYYPNPNQKESYCGQGLHMLFQYPILAKAFLQSKVVKVEHCCGKDDRINEFWMEGVTIPENYKLFKQSAGLKSIEQKGYTSDYSRYISYDSLEDRLRKAIDDQYEKQQAEKKVAGSKHDERNNF